MIQINWNPVPYWGPVPVNWYGITFALGFLAGGGLARRWAAAYGISREQIERLLIWLMVGTVAGARLYFVVQNDFMGYLAEPWRILAVWEGGLAFFGGLFGAIAAGYVYLRRSRLPFWRVADVFAPAIPVGAAIGRIACGLDGMDYGTATALPWGFVYTSPNTYAPRDGVPRHPDQFYELFGDLLIAGVLLKLRGKLPAGALFLLYLVLFSALRFFLFFVRGNVAAVALGLKNAQWTALGILAVSIPILVFLMRRRDVLPHRA